MTLTLLTLACAASGLLQASPADSLPPRPITQLVHTRWTTKDGAPTELRALAQTTDGYLWLGTVAGLFRFDGVRFVPFAPLSGDTVPARGVRRLLGSRDGSLWIVWRNGAVSRFHQGRVTTYGEQDGLPATFTLAESTSGMLVAGTATGLARFADGTWKDVSREWRYPGSEAKAVGFDHDGALWVETEDRIVYRPASGRDFMDPGILLRTRSNPADFAVAKDGQVWMAELGRSAHTLRRVGDQQPLTEVMVGTWSLLIDRKGSLWIGSAGDGLRRILDPTRLPRRPLERFGPESETFTEQNGLLSDVIYALLEDREGNIWVATGRGLERFREGPFTPIATPGSVRPRWIYATSDTAVWTAAFGVDGILRIGRRDQRRILMPTDFLLETLVQDSSGAVLTTDETEVWRYQGGRFARLPLAPSLARNFNDITIDPSGTLWLYDGQLGLHRLSGDSLVPVGPILQPTGPHTTLFSDRQGRIWIAQLDRVGLYDHGQQRLFGPGEGIGQGLVNRIYEDRAGNVWAAGEGGLSRFDGARFRRIADGNGIPGRAVFALTEDATGAWWLANQTGVLRLPAGELDRALADSTYPIQSRHFDLLDGLPGTVTHATWGAALTQTPDGRIWVATDSGVASVDPRHLPLPPALPVLIETLRINGRELAAEATTIPAGAGDLEIDYTAISLAAPERVEFRYQLEGEDRDWHSVGTRRRAYYTGLGPGAYRFRVVASNGDGIWNETGATLAFRVLPAWYQTLWFDSGVVLLIVGLSAAGAVLIQRAKHDRAQRALTGRYEATLAERARIAQDLHDTLLQGFAGVSMQLKAAERALPDEPDVAAETLIRVQQLTRETLREARERVMDLHEPDLGTEDLAEALETNARRMIGTTGIEFSLITKGVRRRLARELEVAAIGIGREAITNAMKHAEARHISCVVCFEPAVLRLELRDDGRGFTLEQGERARQEGHLGLSGMRKRAAQAGGSCAVRSEQGGGTVVTVELPVASFSSAS